MGGMGGGGKAKMPSQPVMAPTPPPQVTMVEDTSIADETAKRAKRAAALMAGRQSTILTDTSNLGEPTVNKRALLGGG